MALTRPRAAQVNFDVTNITDPLIRLNSGQSGSNDKDAGIVIERGSDTNVAVIWDESADELAIVNTAEDGSTSGNVTISSYANVRANAYYGDGSNLTGIGSSDYGDSDVASYLSANGYGTSSSIIASITDSAPGTLDTLNELAAALGDDANFSTTVTNSLASKAPLASPALTGIPTVAGNRILTTADEGTGNGLDADTVDGIQASSFLRSDADDTKTGNIVLQTSAGVESATSGLFFETGGTYTDGRYRTRFRKQDVGGGIPLYIDQSYASANSYTARARFGTYSGNSYEFEVFGDIKANGNVDVTGVFNGTATSSQYADLAEKYLADADYPIGTVLEIGGDAEVTIASPHSYKIVGTVSEKPGLLMNSGLEGEHVVPVAYIGRVPCRVQGNVNRGDFLVVGNTPGVAVAEHPMNILMGAAIGKALENHDSNDEGIIEILVGRL